MSGTVRYRYQSVADVVLHLVLVTKNSETTGITSRGEYCQKYLKGGYIEVPVDLVSDVCKLLASKVERVGYSAVECSTGISFASMKYAIEQPLLI